MAGTTVSLRSLPELIDRLRALESYRTVVAALQRGSSGTIDGAWGSSCALVAAAIAQDAPGPLLLVLPRISDVEDFSADIAALLPAAPTVFPAWETLPKERSVKDAVFGARLRVLQLLESKQPPKVIITAFPALLQPVPSRSVRESGAKLLKIGGQLDIDELLRWLVERGFERVSAIEMPGEFCVHGGIVDIFPPDAIDPIRMELFGDEIESLRFFSVETQRKVSDLKEIQLTAVAPTSDVKNQEEANFLDSLPKEAWIALSELRDVVDEGKRFLQRLENPRGLFGVDGTLARCTSFPTVSVSALNSGSFDTTAHLQVESIERFSGPKAEVIQELAGVLLQDEQVLIACHNAGEKERLQEMIREADPALEQRMQLCLGTVTRGYRLIFSKVVVLSDNELFNRANVRQPTKKTGNRTASRAIDSFLELNEGDLVVHLTHGIGRFQGMQVVERDGNQEEHLVIEFRDGVRIYVPVTLIHLVQKYVGASKSSPRLAKIGGTSWAKNKKKVSEAVSDMAADMLKLQAKRSLQTGLACPPDSKWQQEFDTSFPFVETADQLRAIEDCKGDLIQPRPMDRLICGDVGFGKTEVAMRSAFKVVDAGRQVAVLVPTTVLAEQHFRSFSQRMAEFPIQIASLSRFITKGEQRKVVEKLESGGIDIVIGTHRLVSQDVRFRNLGLLIVDEEQRFGVATKELLKQLRLNVDVLTLSATPIPRTLHLSLLGIRDISNLTTPPQDRLPIETRIARWDADLIRSAIMREFNRSGQVYFVHNRVYDIERVSERLQQIVPEATIAIAHGQMTPDELESSMVKFVNGKADILVATTIIESGLDIPTANTMFIDQAENYGLADLHQLRGRVGRDKHRAYCYLLVSENRSLTGVAARRLKAIEEFSELGAGFKISMRDLEIRGAGNILGTEQSGHISTVGYELYCQLLENAVRRMKELPPRESPHVNLDLPVTAFLPGTYIPPGRQKIDVYRKLSSVCTRDELAEVADEIRDRFGPLPKEAIQFISLKELELMAYTWGVDGIRLEEDRFAVLSYTDDQRIHDLAGRHGRDLRIVDRRNAYLVLPKKGLRGAKLADFLKSVLR
ncbi:transcription-repair coupling factor [Planctomicrobium piriforme]|uniref:Transcription-repair-coupling factor n=1 Tax=Planctomicrobium piriforme TaxID=1576369 RepID=A0A1I3GU19_9PLAN|nr:transcription-repair coupling factor [Planctomicrobium piriforme]SFI26859.1 transcription-repair coupling factor (superfamily II helicase) [Planctomicrobium piriforme]